MRIGTELKTPPISQLKFSIDFSRLFYFKKNTYHTNITKKKQLEQEYEKCMTDIQQEAWNKTPQIKKNHW